LKQEDLKVRDPFYLFVLSLSSDRCLFFGGMVVVVVVVVVAHSGRM